MRRGANRILKSARMMALEICSDMVVALASAILLGPCFLIYTRIVKASSELWDDECERGIILVGGRAITKPSSMLPLEIRFETVNVLVLAILLSPCSLDLHENWKTNLSRCNDTCSRDR